MVICKLTSLYKKGDKSLPCNYRPVSLTCVPCKLLEHIICSNIMAHMDEYKLLSDRQHAFLKKHSCETQLITVINDWAKILDHDRQIDTFILDFKKAFYTLPPTTASMNYLNVIDGKTMKWIYSFLCDRQKHVLVKMLNRTGPLFCQVFPKAQFLNLCWPHYTLMALQILTQN